MLEPAITGTRNVMKACLMNKVKKVVVVSSILAIAENPIWPHDQAMDENCWSDADYCIESEKWYCAGKTISEREALEFGKSNDLKVVSVCPSVVFGPMLQGTLCTTNIILLNLFKGENTFNLIELENAEEDTDIPIVDVRDCAKALLLAYEKPESEGRYLCFAHMLRTKALVEILKSLFPQYNYPTNLRVSNKESKYNHAKIMNLGWNYMSLEKTLIDSFEKMQELACSIPHSDDEIEALVKKQIVEDMVHQKAILDLALQFDNACTTKEDLRKAYEKCNHIPQESGSSSQTHEIGDVYLTAEELHQLHLDEETLRETLEEQTMNEKARGEKIMQKQVDDDEYFMEFEVMRIDSDYDEVLFSDLHLTHVEPSLYTTNPVTIIPGPAGVVQLFNSICVEPSSSTPNPVRIIPGPAGLVHRARLLKENVFILDPDGALMSTQEYMQKVVEDVGEDADFNSGAWVSATNYVNAFGGTVTGCLGDIDNFLKWKT
ncbi:cinnamoyl-CoA reductase 2-like protein [Tanacetum coccineum]